MKHMKRTLPVFLVLLACVPLAVVARSIPNWFLEPGEITKRSDLVVVARPLASRACGAVTNAIMAGFETNDFGYSSRTNAFLPTETRFEVVELIKGEVTTNAVTILHFTWVLRCRAAMVAVAVRVRARPWVLMQ